MLGKEERCNGIREESEVGYVELSPRPSSTGKVEVTVLSHALLLRPSLPHRLSAGPANTALGCEAPFWTGFVSVNSLFGRILARFECP
jgi:hypothetical protein